MLTNTNRYVSADVKNLINEVIAESTRYDLDLRSVHREKIVLPVNLTFRNGQPTIAAFSRNLSTSGACLVTREPIEAETAALVHFYRLNTKPSQVVGECKWCRPFGSEYWMSGWQFLRVPSR